MFCNWFVTGLLILSVLEAIICKSNSVLYSDDFAQEILNIIKDAIIKDSDIPCKMTSCKCFLPVMKNDLEPYERGVNQQMISSIMDLGTMYQIIDHKLYREPKCYFPSRCSGIEHFLLYAAKYVPDTEFVINTKDWPQILKGDHQHTGPIFSFSKTYQYMDIMYPAWSFWEGGPAIKLYPKGIGRWDLHRESLGRVGNETAWRSKKPIAFFRGSRTSAERDPVVKFSRMKPHLVDAQYTKNQAWKSDADTLNRPPASEVTFEHHCQYKYLFNFRGVAASFRLKHIMLCKSLVLHMNNAPSTGNESLDWLEFFYPLMKPWIHYAPVKTENFEALLEFFQRNDDLAEIIAERGYEFVWNFLTMDNIGCYWRKLLQRYTKLLTYKPILNSTFILIGDSSKFTDEL